ncbi:ABC transporter permease subunit [Paraburkholderia sp. Ac-20336]|uniref:ABC transporter permease n=2 Tax=Burkholderiaceae TaxID=119060 RepID=UPI00141F41B1|nr:MULTISPECIES: ABC transporter permease subunit [unclassified Paraburkholderia]MBN3801868.1 ABC transporter permease subunit [Paraburkholderia sp. Ac-20336]NIF55496.1 ABC transporter permease subunit [Burkholderia sp. Ax-1724]NIF81338.1 ABC transporter permease subunit [Paraburkholderia sp. Cy-641]
MLDVIARPFQHIRLPLGQWADALVTWLVLNFRSVFQEIRYPVQFLLDMIQHQLSSVHPFVLIGALMLVGWQVAGGRAGIVIGVCLFALGAIGAWADAMDTLSIVFTAIVLCAMIGIPVGVVAGLSARFNACLRVLLDFMQSIPSFVYLVPVVMLFGIGNVSGVLVTVIYAISPIIRLTSLGIRQVRPDVLEAGHAFGCSPLKILFRVRLPLARPTIMAGVNQTVMLALSMAVVAAMISVAGLGQMVLRGIGQLDVATATTGGVGIVLLAITIDRISQGLGMSLRDHGMQRWCDRGPLGMLNRIVRRFHRGNRDVPQPRDSRPASLVERDAQT